MKFFFFVKYITMHFYLRLIIAGISVIYGPGCGGTTLYKSNNQMDEQNTVLQIFQTLYANSCGIFRINSIYNPLYPGAGERYWYIAGTCSESEWGTNLGFSNLSAGGVTTYVASSAVIDAPTIVHYGTNIEVTFTVTDPSGTLDVMAYGTGTFPGTSTTNPTFQILAGNSCALGYRSSSGTLAYFSTCKKKTLSVGNTYTYCLDFNRGNPSGGLYGSSDMLAAWDKPCDWVLPPQSNSMGAVPYMQMEFLPVMKPGNSKAVGFSSSGIKLDSFKIGNTIFQSKW